MAVDGPSNAVDLVPTADGPMVLRVVGPIVPADDPMIAAVLNRMIADIPAVADLIMAVVAAAGDPMILVRTAAGGHTIADTLDAAGRTDHPLRRLLIVATACSNLWRGKHCRARRKPSRKRWPI